MVTSTPECTILDPATLPPAQPAKRWKIDLEDGRYISEWVVTDLQGKVRPKKFMTLAALHYWCDMIVAFERGDLDAADKFEQRSINSNHRKAWGV